MVTQSEAKILSSVKKTLDAKLRQQTQEGLAKVFTELRCGGVAKEIKGGRNVVGNVEYGIKMCVHEKLGPRVDPSDWSFTPQTKRGREMEHQFISLVNKTLENGGYPKLDQGKIIKQLRVKDRAFEKDIMQRRRSK